MATKIAAVVVSTNTTVAAVVSAVFAAVVATDVDVVLPKIAVIVGSFVVVSFLVAVNVDADVIGAEYRLVMRYFQSSLKISK